MYFMIQRYARVRVPVQTTLRKMREQERNKQKKKKLNDLLFSDDDREKELLDELVTALGIVMKASTLLCGNNVTLSAADRVSSHKSNCLIFMQGVTDSYTYPCMP